MLSIPFILHLGYEVLILRRRYYLLYYSLIFVAVHNLPSLIKEYFYLMVGGRTVGPSDPLLVVTMLYFILNRRAQEHVKRNRSIAAIVAITILFSLLELLYLWVVRDGADSWHVRGPFVGGLALMLLLVEFNILEDARGQRGLTYALAVSNLMILATALLVAVYPELNEIESRFATGINILSSTQAIALVSVTSGYICVFSLYYNSVILRKSLLSLNSIVPIFMILLSAHRITYLALFLVIVFYIYRNTVMKDRSEAQKRHGLVKVVIGMVLVASIITVFTVRYSDIVSPYIDRFTSLSDKSDLTRLERVDQFRYYFERYVPQSTMATLLLGQSFSPRIERDYFYSEIVQPHNIFVLVLVEGGIVGGLLFLVLLLLCIIRTRARRGGLMLGMVVLILFMQLTDTGFIYYPISTVFALALGLSISNSKGKDYELTMRAFAARHGVRVRYRW